MTDEPLDDIPVQFGMFHVFCFVSAACLATVGWLTHRCRR
jgi:hypothetical protein